MPSISSPPSRVSRTTVRIAFTILGGIAIGQVAAAGVILGPRIKQVADRIRSALVDELPQAPQIQEEARTSPIADLFEVTNDQSRVSLGEATLPSRVEAEPSPAMSPAATEDFVLRSSLEAVLVARSARKSGDMQMALDKLREAQAFGPDNAEVLAELALTYEQMGLLDKAIAHWRMVYQLGPRAGMYFRVASEKITRGVGVPAAGESGDVQGLITGGRERSKLVIERTEVERSQSDGQGDVRLRLWFKAQDPPISPKDVKVEVFFYDILDDQDVVLTNAETVYEWERTPPDWVNGRIEQLSINYLPSDADPELEEERGRKRQYLGHIVRLYYQRKLQDVDAEPRRLLDLFPPPAILTDDLPEVDDFGG
ncbi:MAG: hypothetical protein SNJ52_04460 [Verrucomicrobiia bacterium]